MLGMRDAILPVVRSSWPAARLAIETPSWRTKWVRLRQPLHHPNAGVTNMVPARNKAAPQDHVGRPRACSKNNINMITISA